MTDGKAQPTIADIHDLLCEMDKTKNEIDTLRNERERLSREVSGAEVRLSNLQTKFTHAVIDRLDRGVLATKFPVRQIGEAV